MHYLKKNKNLNSFFSDKIKKINNHKKKGGMGIKQNHAQIKNIYIKISMEPADV